MSRPLVHLFMLVLVCSCLWTSTLKGTTSFVKDDFLSHIALLVMVLALVIIAHWNTGLLKIMVHVGRKDRLYTKLIFD